MRRVEEQESTTVALVRVRAAPPGKHVVGYVDSGAHFGRAREIGTFLVGRKRL